MIPPPTERNIAVYIDAAAERAIRDGHPWLFDDSIRKLSREGRSGDLAVLFDRKQRFLAVGLYDPGSPIRVRILQHGSPAPIGEDWFKEKIRAAAKIRLPFLGTETTGYRLVHGENDGMPGLVVDRYDATLVIKLYTTAWIVHLRSVLSALEGMFHPERVVLRLSRTIYDQKQDLHGLADGDVLMGSDVKSGVHFLENELQFEADVIRGHKTGFYLDQRENRARVEKLSQGKEVLNVFAYTGGFSLYAARGRARRVISLDLNRFALEGANRNFHLNRHVPNIAAAKHETLQGDAFQCLADLKRRGRHFDLVVVDPPSFAGRQEEVDNALSAYRRLTLLSLDVLRAGGTLVTSSCTSRVDASTFFDLVHRTAANAGRPLREVERTRHPIDHPVSYREGAYLKCLYAVAP